MLTRVIEFLRNIGLTVVVEPGASGFTKGVRIAKGALYVDLDCRPSTLLHEAGHICCVPGRFRSYLDGDLKAGLRRMISDVQSMDLPPDNPLERAVVQCSDPEATAWAWAAGVHLGLKADDIIMSDEYQNGGDHIRLMLQTNGYYGINGLAHAGMCKRGAWAPASERYPVMQKWLQDH